jgi:hypothetical protein
MVSRWCRTLVGRCWSNSLTTRTAATINPRNLPPTKRQQGWQPPNFRKSQEMDEGNGRSRCPSAVKVSPLAWRDAWSGSTRSYRRPDTIDDHNSPVKVMWLDHSQGRAARWCMRGAVWRWWVRVAATGRFTCSCSFYSAPITRRSMPLSADTASGGGRDAPPCRYPPSQGHPIPL